MVMQQYLNFCEPIRGGVAGPLVKIRPLNATDAAAGKLVAGRVVTLNNNGEFVAGNGNDKKRMPLFLIMGTNTPSVWSSGVAGGITRWVPVGHIGHGAVALVATGGYEIQTTEFDAAATYNPNDPLTADANGRIVRAATPATDWVVGVCSWHENVENIQGPATGPKGTNAHGVQTLTFWSVFRPIYS